MVLVQVARNCDKGKLRQQVRVTIDKRVIGLAYRIVKYLNEYLPTVVSSGMLDW